MKGTLLKIVSTIAFAAVVFPFIFSIDVNSYVNINFLRILYYYGIGAVIAFIGYLGSELSKTHKKLKIPVRIFGLLTFGAGFMSLLIGGDGLTVFALGAMSVFMFFLGERFGYKNFADMFPLTAFAAYIVLAIACYIFAAVSASESGLDAAPEIIIIAFAIEFIAAALLVNQSGIYDRANMRKETKTTIPKGLSAYNAALVLGFTITGLSLCIFRKQIAWFLQQCVIVIMKAVFALSQLFHSERMQIEPGEPGEASLMGYEQTRIGYIIQALGIITIVVLIIVFRHRIFAAIKAFFAKLGSIFSGRPEESDRPDFTDVFESYTGSSRNIKKSDNIYAVRRKYNSESDPAKKYRLGYRILLFRIKAVNQRLMPSDTTSVQAERGAERFGEDEMERTVSVYDSVRYGTAVPDSTQLSQLKDLVDKQ